MRLDHPNILPECYVDTNLIEYLMHGTVSHQQGCNQVVGTLKRRFSDRFAVGVIDKDKVKVGYLAECELVIETDHLCVLKHKELPHFLITVKPAIDRFLLDCAKRQGVRPDSFGIPSQLKAFTKQSKKETSNHDSAFRNLIIALKDDSEIVFLGKTLRYLQECQYNSQPDFIKQLWLDLQDADRDNGDQ